jgi:hypothetical protein
VPRHSILSCTTGSSYRGIRNVRNENRRGDRKEDIRTELRPCSTLFLKAPEIAVVLRPLQPSQLRYFVPAKVLTAELGTDNGKTGNVEKVEYVEFVD